MRTTIAYTTVALVVSMAIASEPARSNDTPSDGNPESEKTGPWIKFSGNPVMPAGPPDAWNNFKTDPSVLKHEGRYKMWYTTNQDGTATKMAYAESFDGIDWIHYPTPVLDLGPAGSWDDKDIECPTVIIDEDAPANERFKVWYCAYSTKDPEQVYRIGYATSPDGIRWTRHGNKPVLDLGDAERGEYDTRSVADPMVLKEGNTYKMWYSAVGDIPEKKSWGFWVGYATSDDGVLWKRSVKPVLPIGESGTFESRAVGQPTVLFNGSEYEMWYAGWSSIEAGWESEIGHAVSPDGIQWTKSPGNPIIEKGKPEDWDGSQTVAPTALLEGDEYKVWYTGHRFIYAGEELTGMKIGIGYATGKRR